MRVCLVFLLAISRISFLIPLSRRFWLLQWRLLAAELGSEVLTVFRESPTAVGSQCLCSPGSQLFFSLSFCG